MNYINFMKRLEEDFPEVPSEYSDDFKELISKCLVRDPRQRPTASELLKLKCMKKQEKIGKDTIKNLFKVIRNQINLQKEMTSLNQREEQLKKKEEENLRKTNKVWEGYK